MRMIAHDPIWIQRPGGTSIKGEFLGYVGRGLVKVCDGNGTEFYPRNMIKPRKSPSAFESAPTLADHAEFAQRHEMGIVS